MKSPKPSRTAALLAEARRQQSRGSGHGDRFARQAARETEHAARRLRDGVCDLGSVVQAARSIERADALGASVALLGEARRDHDDLVETFRSKCIVKPRPRDRPRYE